MKAVEVRREELLRMIAALEAVVRMKVEPFAVQLGPLLERLRRIVEENRDAETLVLDAEALYRVSVVLALQQRSIVQSASSLFVDSQIVASKVVGSPPVALAGAFLLAWRPMVRLEHVSTPLLIRGYEHFLSLSTRAQPQSAPSPSEGLRVEWAFLEEGFEEELEKVLSELRSRGGWVDYWSFISEGGGGKRARTAYLLSFLITRGDVEVRYNPLTGELKIRAAERREEAEGERVSLAISVR
jgi:hypothetical protein